MFKIAPTLTTIIFFFASICSAQIDSPDESKVDVDSESVVDQYFEKSVAERYGFSGGFSLRGRHQTNSFGDRTHHRVQSRLVLDTFVSLNDSGCLKAKGQITTGSKFDSVWDDTSIGDSEEDLHINLRRLYLDLACYKKHAIQIGALPPHTPGELGIKSDGWVDGMRAVILVGADRKIRVVMTAGEVDEFDEPSVFDRGWDGGNYLQLGLDGKLTDRVSFAVDITEHDSNDYLRGVLDIAVGDITKWIDSIGIENLVANSHQNGLMLSADKQIGSWNLTVSTTDIREAQLNEGTLPLPNEDFFGKGRNHQISLSKEFAKKWVMRLRFRDGDAGSRFELRFDYKFKFGR
jgi:hypothetical protein